MQARPGNMPARLPPLPSHLMEHASGKMSNHIMSSVASSSATATAINNSPTDGSNAGAFVSRILQVALGLFVTTMDLPSMPLEQSLNPHVTFDCDFSTACRWNSIGSTPDRWRLARGEPDVLLWLASTGTMILPSEPFTLIEVRGGTPGDMLTSDVIGCQRDASLFSFTYWTIGLSDLEICLLDLQFRQFNCTGMLQSHIQPGKVALKIPPIKHPFHIAIIPSTTQGILIIDDIKYDAKYCGIPPPMISPLPLFPTESPLLPETTYSSSSTLFPTYTVRPPAGIALPWSPPPVSIFPQQPFTFGTSTPMPIIPVSPIRTTTEYTLGVRITEAPLIFTTTSTRYPIGPMTPPQPIMIVPEPFEPFVEGSAGRYTKQPFFPETKPFNLRFTTPPPSPPDAATSSSFDLLIIGNRTSPLHDRRRGRLIDDTGDLLCDFANNFPCFWGPEAGKWAIIEKGAIPSLEAMLISNAQLPAYPAAVVIQSSAMFTSDPIRCQTGEGKLLFRYWTNGRVLIQVCAMGYNLDSDKIQCVEEVAQSNSMDDTTLAVFQLANEIREPFTLNIVPIWQKDSRNNYMVIDEIAYIGECNLTVLNEIAGNAGTKSSGNSGEEQSGESSEVASSQEYISVTMNPDLHVIYTEKTLSSSHNGNPTITSTISYPTSLVSSSKATTTRRPLRPIQVFPNNRKPGTRYPYTPTRPPYRTTTQQTTTNSPTTTTTIEPRTETRETVTKYPEIKTTTKNSFTIAFTPASRSKTTTEDSLLDYCKLLNCDFNDNACNYLNHGLTKVAWTLRTKNYGFPLSRNTDLRPTPSNAQFISTVLGPGDFAILESPRFNLTKGINVLLFQYYRPTHSSTIRLCMGTKYSKPLKTVSSFLQCPPILRSLTSKNAYKWNSVHIQLPPGSSHFYLVAHNLERSTEKVAIAIDNIRVAICDPRSFDPSTIDLEHSHEDAIYQNDPPPPPPLSESDIETTERR